MINDVLEEAQLEMEISIEALQNDLDAIRTGRASSALVEKIRVDYYDTPTMLQKLASISVPEAQLIVIRPFDPGALKNIERGLMQSDLGITPNNDGKVIRLAIPPLTEERRRELAKRVNHRVEEGKVSVRNHRRDAMKALHDLEKEKDITEDDFYRGRDELQKLTDEYIEKADQIGKAKEEEITTI